MGRQGARDTKRSHPTVLLAEELEDGGRLLELELDAHEDPVLLLEGEGHL